MQEWRTTELHQQTTSSGEDPQVEWLNGSGMNDSRS